MNFLSKAIVITLINMLAIYLAQIVVPGFSAPSALYPLLIIALILTGLNMIIKPVLNLLLFPIAWLTFGLSSLAINLGMLLILDYLREDVTINGLASLFLGTLLISVVNLICQRLLLPKS